MKKYTFTHYKNRFWCVGELKCNDDREWKINRFWEVDKEWFYIFDTAGSSGSGFTEGALIEKIYIGDAEFKIVEATV
ncbi:hypothetical protein KAR91_69880 [Candidatus Pacearchaeota archaeon]|nr:hypothetical protein [Candidatus Pacearchaeota archaeon]